MSFLNITVYKDEDLGGIKEIIWEDIGNQLEYLTTKELAKLSIVVSAILVERMPE